MGSMMWTGTPLVHAAWLVPSTECRFTSLRRVPRRAPALLRMTSGFLERMTLVRLLCGLVDNGVVGTIRNSGLSALGWWIRSDGFSLLAARLSVLFLAGSSLEPIHGVRNRRGWLHCISW